MKKSIALVVTGTFLLVLGVLSTTYIYPRVAVVPRNLDSAVIASNAENDPATYFSIADLAEKTAVLSNNNTARVDARASDDVSDELGKDVLVIDSYACSDLATVDCTTMDTPLSATATTLAIDPHSGEAVRWDGTTIATGGQTDTDVAVEGLTIKFPFHAQKKGYEFWNASLREAVPVTYVGETKVKGLAAYEYEQMLAPTVLGQLDVPGSLVGSDRATVSVDNVSSGTTTYLVEPETGVILSATSAPDNYATFEGERAFTITQGSFVSPDDVVADTVAEYRPLARALFAVRVVVPVVGIGLGVILLVLGLVLGARSRRRSGTGVRAVQQDRMPVGAR